MFLSSLNVTITKEILSLEAMNKDLLIEAGIEPAISSLPQPDSLGDPLFHDSWMRPSKFFKGFVIFIIKFFFPAIILLDIGVIMIVVFQPSISLQHDSRILPHPTVVIDVRTGVSPSFFRAAFKIEFILDTAETAHIPARLHPPVIPNHSNLSVVPPGIKGPIISVEVIIPEHQPQNFSPAMRVFNRPHYGVVIFFMDDFVGIDKNSPISLALLEG
jgi:hypothetical protein